MDVKVSERINKIFNVTGNQEFSVISLKRKFICMLPKQNGMSFEFHVSGAKSVTICGDSAVS